ncbi:MAG: hypothetical protein MZU84_01620 [Sphingobacterium sp.]|nr:hypothetical protein [Sphingobacterium sp.]
MKVQRKVVILLNISIIGLLLFFSLILPDEILFGANADSRRLILPQGDNILLAETGFTFWRAIIDLTIIIVCHFHIPAFIESGWILSASERSLFFLPD